MRISVVIPVLNGEEFLPALIGALQGSDEPPDEILIVDDGSSDGSRTFARDNGCRVYTTPQAQSGPAIARNIGIYHANGEIIFFLDADVVPHPDVMTRVRHHFRDNPELDGLFGSYDDNPSDPHFISQYKNLFHHYVHQRSEPQASTFWTGCGALRRDTCMALGGFTDEYGRPCIEDIELGYRLTRQGGTIYLDRDLLVTHRKRWTFRGLLRTDILDRGIPWAELILRHRAFVNDLNLQTKNRVSVVMTWLLLASTFLAFFQPVFLLPIVILAAILLKLNWQLYRWYAAKRGWWFALNVIPLHWLYYCYNGIAFSLGTIQYLRSAYAAGRKQPDRPGALVRPSAEN